MTKRIVLSALLFAFALAIVAQVGTARASDDEKMTTLVGCLNAGDAEGHFVLTTEKDGDVQVTGGEGIAAHAENHKVELAGKWVDDGEGAKHFEADSVKHLAICE
jgi:hypothetical protein